MMIAFLVIGVACVSLLESGVRGTPRYLNRNEEWGVQVLGWGFDLAVFVGCRRWEVVARGGGKVKELGMANLTLVYGMRLLPADEVASVGEAAVALKNGKEAHVTMHVLEGSREQIEAQLRLSIDAFFDFYPEI
jgi:hypothetical protein